MTPVNLAAARHIARYPSLYDPESWQWARFILLRSETPDDRADSELLRRRLADRGWSAGVTAAVMLFGRIALIVALGILVIATIFVVLHAVDWDAVLRFVAPTAFETRPVEEILEGVAGSHHG